MNATPPPRRRPHWTWSLVALALGAAGGYLFHWADLPLPWMLGSLTFCLVAALARVPLGRTGPALPVMRAVLGLAVGGAFTPALAAQAAALSGSLAFVVPHVALIGGFGFWYFRRVARFDRATAFFSAMPGGLNDMIAMGEGHGGDARVLALVHATRVVVLVFLLPFLIQGLSGVDLSRLPTGGSGHLPASFADLTLTDAAVLFACGAVGWWGAARLGISGATIVGPMVVCAVVHLLGWTTARPPVVAINAAQWIIGVQIGSLYTGASLRLIGRAVWLSLGFVLAALALAAGFTALVTRLTGYTVAPVLLAFAPGGQGEMNLIAVALGTDVAYVALHHLLRMVLVILGAQVVFRTLGRRGAGARAPGD
ncbi:MAG: AbrB family transcriptional regulator [Hyphomicrobiales bacterium]|nr:AbrB family transcriptional regulator [Hyphomicrobiales bacterium]